VLFWDVFGEQGHPVRATVTEMGPAAAVANARSQTTSRKALLNVAFRVADEKRP